MIDGLLMTRQPFDGMFVIGRMPQEQGKIVTARYQSFGSLFGEFLVFFHSRLIGFFGISKFGPSMIKGSCTADIITRQGESIDAMRMSLESPNQLALVVAFLGRPYFNGSIPTRRIQKS
jgi:hypothetical protein